MPLRDKKASGQSQFSTWCLEISVPQKRRKRKKKNYPGANLKSFHNSADCFREKFWNSVSSRVRPLGIFILAFWYPTNIRINLLSLILFSSRLQVLLNLGYPHTHCVTQAYRWVVHAKENLFRRDLRPGHKQPRKDSTENSKYEEWMVRLEEAQDSD